MVTFLGQELSANAKIDMDKDKDKIEKVHSKYLFGTPYMYLNLRCC